MLDVIKRIEAETVLSVLRMIKQENNGVIPDYILEKISARYSFGSIRDLI